MMTIKNRIQRLSPQLINQIAAGEVIERPASVVKELVENSLDAGATRIEIDIELGGKQLIQIRDNGHGILKDDLPLAIGSHATSKIQHFSDLEKIASLGFRGEALASISSISRFSIQSRAQETDSSWQIKLAGRADEAVIQPCAHPVGTTITVRDLFFNTPARRKFMRTDKTELLHIEEVIKRVALSRFGVDFILRHHGKDILNVKAAKKPEQIITRINKIFGKGFIEHAKEVDAERVGLRLWGWLATPDFHRSQNDLQYFYLNGRMVKDKLIAHAIRQAYQDSVFEGRHPAFCLHLECDPIDVDVNVHPTKHEVRFQQARLVHDFIVQACQSVLGQAPTVNHTSNFSRNQISQSEIAQSLSFQQPRQVESKTTFKSSFVTLLGLLKPHYAAIEFEQKLMVIDCKRAQQSLLKQRLAQSPLTMQPLLIPENFHFAQTAIQKLEAKVSFLSALGFELSLMGPEMVTVRQVPSVLRPYSNKTMLAALLADVMVGADPAKCIDTLAAHIEVPASGWSRSQIEDLLTDIEAVPNWQQQAYCAPIDCEQLFHD